MKASWKEIHQFWFGNQFGSMAYIQERLPIWFCSDQKIDQLIAEKFGHWPDLNPPHELFSHWKQFGPKAIVSAILVYDQIPRHIYRKSPPAHFFDSCPLEWANYLIENKLDGQLHDIEKLFSYLPFQHSENIQHQKISMILFDQLYQKCHEGLKPFFSICLEKAHLHYLAIEKFGRFPHRNHYLNRASDAKELLFLENPDHHF